MAVFCHQTKTDHIVPLSVQAVEILANLKSLTGEGRFVFPSALTPNGSRAMSDNALRVALRRMGFTNEEMTTHGFRAMARTILNENLGFRPDFIEHQFSPCSTRLYELNLSLKVSFFQCTKTIAF